MQTEFSDRRSGAINILIGPLFGSGIREDRALLPAYSRSRSEKRGAPSAAFRGVEIGQPVPSVPMEQTHRPTFVRPAFDMLSSPSRHDEPAATSSRGGGKTIDMRQFGSTVRPSSPTPAPPIYTGYRHRAA